MVAINFYTFSKNENSTRRISGDGLELECVFVEPCDIIRPRIALAHKNPTEYNYMRIATFNRYYFIDNWSWSGGRWVASCHVDVLASWKTYIGNSRQYVVRSASSFDGNIMDTLYPTKSDFTFGYSVGTEMQGVEFKSRLEDGTFIVGIINSDPSAVGCVSYYAFTNAEFRALCSFLMGDISWAYSGITEISKELTKTLFNPFQYVASCMWFPFTIYGRPTTLTYGYWNTDLNASQIVGDSRVYTYIFDVEKHPQDERGEYLNASPFTRRYLNFPAFGQIAVDATVIKIFDRLPVDLTVDLVSGIGTLVVRPGAIPIFTTQTRIGVPIQLSQMATDYAGTVASFSNAFSHATRLDIGGVFASIGDAVTNAMPVLSTSGTNGSISAYEFKPVLVSEFYKVVDDDIEHRGRPLMQDVIIKNLSGYAICSDAELECPCTSGELSQIKTYLNGGFYYE